MRVRAFAICCVLAAVIWFPLLHVARGGSLFDLGASLAWLQPAPAAALSPTNDELGEHEIGRQWMNYTTLRVSFDDGVDCYTRPNIDRAILSCVRRAS